MKKPPIGTRCADRVFTDRTGSHACCAPVSKFEKSERPHDASGGRKVWWCHQHAPSTKAALEAVRHARWAEEARRRHRRDARLAKEDRRRAALDRLLPLIVDALDRPCAFPDLAKRLRRLLPGGLP